MGVVLFLVFERNTFFKDWTINKILKHLHAGNQAVLASLQGDEAFEAFIKGGDYGRMEKNTPNGLALLEAWMILSTEIAAEFSKTPPKKRLKWFGPSMSARSSITARFMETWSHSQTMTCFKLLLLKLNNYHYLVLFKPI